MTLGIIFVAVFALSYIRFLLNLPSRTQRGFVISGALYVGGALGFEMMSAKYIGDQGYDLFAQSIIIAEEGLEMLGVAAFAYTLLIYLKTHLHTVITIHITPGRHAPPPEEAKIGSSTPPERTCSRTESWTKQPS